MEMASRILLVEGESEVRKTLRTRMEAESFHVEEALDRTDAIDILLKTEFDLLILDFDLPGIDSRFIHEQVRNNFVDAPFIILSSSMDERSMIQGYELGADDYVTKPYSVWELILRIKSILKWTKWNSSPAGIVEYKEIIMHLQLHKVQYKRHEITLRSKEFHLLCYLLKSADRVVSRKELLKKVWRNKLFHDARTVDAHIKRLRKRFECFPENFPVEIVTVWGTGYKLQSTCPKRKNGTSVLQVD